VREPLNYSVLDSTKYDTGGRLSHPKLFDRYLSNSYGINAGFSTFQLVSAFGSMFANIVLNDVAGMPRSMSAV
jgi:hypothetical protein